VNHFSSPGSCPQIHKALSMRAQYYNADMNADTEEFLLYSFQLHGMYHWSSFSPKSSLRELIGRCASTSCLSVLIRSCTVLAVQCVGLT
jgi:hypothetical protein